MKDCETGPTVYRPYPRRLVRQHFLLCYLKTLAMLVRPARVLLLETRLLMKLGGSHKREVTSRTCRRDKLQGCADFQTRGKSVENVRL